MYIDPEDEDWFEPDDEINENVRCRRCGKYGFFWGLHNTGYRLYTLDGNLHSCKAKKTVV